MVFEKAFSVKFTRKFKIFGMSLAIRTPKNIFLQEINRKQGSIKRGFESCNAVFNLCWEHELEDSSVNPKIDC